MSVHENLTSWRSNSFASIFDHERGSLLGGPASCRSARKEVSGLPGKAKKTKSFVPPDKAARPRLVVSRSVGSKGAAKSAVSQSSEYKLHIVLDKESFMIIRGLKAQLEASTEAEVIRRALKAYEIFEPDEDDIIDNSVGPNHRPVGGVEHLYVRIPLRMKERLDVEQKTSGKTYAEQVRQALRVLTQLLREVQKIREENGRLVIPPNSSEREREVLIGRLLLLAAAF